MRKFTFVELIVTMTTVIFLGTISLVSYVGYSSTSRDFLRTRDTADIGTSLQLYVSKHGVYPTPTDAVDIKYSGNLVWKQGTVGRSVLNALDRMVGTPKDPFFGTEYVYSTTSSKLEYQMATIMEEQGVEYNKFIPKNIMPGAKRGEAYVLGNYNGYLLKAGESDSAVLLAMPSILTNNILYRDVKKIMAEQRLIYNGYLNLPHNLVEERINTNGGFNYSSRMLKVHSGDINELYDSIELRKELLEKAIQSYDGTIVQNDEELKELIYSDGLYKVLGIESLESNE